MARANSERTMRMCALYQRGMPVAEIAHSFGVLNPAVWSALRRGGVLPPYAAQTHGGPGRPSGGGKPGSTKQPPRPDQIVDREPCFKCGVRADIGCKHTRAFA